MTDTEQKAAAKKFVERWRGHGYEKGESQKFWLSLLHDVYGVEDVDTFIEFEDQVHLDHTSFIDAMIPSTRVMIEQKSRGKLLGAEIKQSDGKLLTPFQQAKRYIVELPVDQHPKWVVTCNFEEFWVYNMNNPTGDPDIIMLEDLPREAYRLEFLVDTSHDHLKRETEVSIAAGEIVGLLYDAFAKQYVDPESKKTLHSLNVLCVRLVFCFFAEDSGIFGHHGMFHDYMSSFDTRQMRRGLIDLFNILDTPREKRDPYLAADNPALAAFPYVNGGLFSDEDIEIPPFTDEIRTLILKNACDDFDWSGISPTIFGSVFESTLNPETRRSGGMHYTSVENIHKVIDPLFLDDLNAEFRAIRDDSIEKSRNQKLDAFQNKLSTLTFLDPACGSGNFLTETYLSLRRIENEILRIREGFHGQMSFGGEAYNPIQVSISQFYGIEVNDFAVTVAKTALWIAESQMMKETEAIVLTHLEFLPLKSYTNIIEGNALRINWEDVVPKQKLSYIMGNPPFVGAMWCKGEKREDIAAAFPECAKPGEIDYVAGWYAIAARLIQRSSIRCAFVSTNSICQGQQVALLWQPLMERYNLKIDFAYRTFRWDSEANLKAQVHCVIVGFSNKYVRTTKAIYDDGVKTNVDHINGYLTNAADVFIVASRKQISGMPLMHMGSMARDGGYLIMSQDEYDDYIKKEPQGKAFVHKYMMGREFINNIPRYCFWLVNANPAEVKRCPLLMERLEKVRLHRLNSPAKETQAFADTPGVFCQLAQPSGNFIAFPKVSSERRRYIPIGFLTDDVIVGDKIYVVENVSLYHFGVLTSSIHNSWMRAVAGRLKSDYSYSNTIVYNNFPWPSPTEAQKAQIEQTAKAILDARALYPNNSLADLYDKRTMPKELWRAHKLNDRAVMYAYGFTKDSDAFSSEPACVAELMKLYQTMVVSV